MLERRIPKARVFLPLRFWSGINSYQWNEMVRFGTVFRFFGSPQRHREHREQKSSLGRNQNTKSNFTMIT